MLLEEFYNGSGESKNKSEYFYTATLAAFLIKPDLTLFDRLLESFEDKEEYEACAGISQAIAFVEESHEKRFADAANDLEIDPDDEGFISITSEKHIEISNQIFEDILKEIYEQQAKGNQESN